MKIEMAVAIKDVVNAYVRRQEHAEKTMRELLKDVPSLEDLDGDEDIDTAPFLVLDNQYLYGAFDENGEFSPFPFGYDPGQSIVAFDRYQDTITPPGDETKKLKMVPMDRDFELPVADFFQQSYEKLPKSFWRNIDQAVADIDELIEEHLPTALALEAAQFHDRIATTAALQKVKLPRKMKPRAVLVESLKDETNALRFVVQSYQDVLRAIDKALEESAENEGEGDGEDGEDGVNEEQP